VGSAQSFVIVGNENLIWHLVLVPSTTTFELGQNEQHS
jgi:hypothetical protein